MLKRLVYSISLAVLLHSGCVYSGVKPYDYCTITKKSNAVDHFRAGDKTIKPKLFMDGLEGLRRDDDDESGASIDDDFGCAEDDVSVDRITDTRSELEKFIDDEIVAHAKIVNKKKTGDFLVLVVPVGYDREEIPMKVEGIVNPVSRMFKGINVDFAYLDNSVPFKFSNVEKHLKWDTADFELLRAKLNKHIKDDMKIQAVLAVIASTEHCGTAYVNGTALAITRDRNFFLYSTAHETGHILGLYDGYEGFYGKTLNNSELFMSLDKLPQYVRKLYYKMRPPIFDTGNVCKGKKVFRFYAEEDIMDTCYNNLEVHERLEQGKEFFTPFQKAIMNYNIHRRLKKK